MLEKRLALACVLGTFLLLLVGGLVHATGSSLACPDWPLCYGQVFPPMQGGILVEHSHRLLASAIGLLTFALAIVLHRRSPELRRLGWAAFALVVFQGLLGGITVLKRLPLLVSMAHLATSMIFFSLLLLILVRLRGRCEDRERLASLGALAPLALASATAVFLQLVLGGLVRHSGAGLACNAEVFTCRGELWPTGPGTTPAQFQMLHRAFGVVVGLLAIGVSLAVARRAKEAGRRTLSSIGLAGPVLVAAQIALGALTVLSGISVPIVTAHFGGGALLLAHQWLIHLFCREEAEPVPASAPLALAEA